MGGHANAKRLVVDYQRARHRVTAKGPRRTDVDPPEAGATVGVTFLTMMAVLGVAIFFQEDDGEEAGRPGPESTVKQSGPPLMGSAGCPTSETRLGWRPAPSPRG